MKCQDRVLVSRAPFKGGLTRPAWQLYLSLDVAGYELEPFTSPLCPTHPLPLSRGVFYLLAQAQTCLRGLPSVSPPRPSCLPWGAVWACRPRGLRVLRVPCARSSGAFSPL